MNGIRQPTATASVWNLLATANPQMTGDSDWAVGSQIGGSPGMPNSFGTIQFAVRVNEVLNNSDPPEVDAVELANYGNETTSIGGWYLTDDLRVPRKYRIPAGTTMEPGSFLVLDETDFGQSTEENVGFRFRALGEEVYLFAASNGELQGYADGFRFRAIPPGKTQGPWMGTDGKRHIVAFQSPTLGTANSEPSIGPDSDLRNFCRAAKRANHRNRIRFRVCGNRQYPFLRHSLVRFGKPRCRMAIPRRHSF